MHSAPMAFCCVLCNILAMDEQTNHAKGKDYEDFVTKVQKAILEAEGRMGMVVPKMIERNKIIMSQSNTPAEIDIYWEYEVADILHSVAIECKNHNRNIDIGLVRDFAAKIQGIGGLKGLMFTTEGYSEEAINLANFHRIDLRVLRKPNDKDWEGKISGARLRMHMLSSPEIVRFTPKINKEWANDNGYKTGDKIGWAAPENEVFLEDKADGFKEHLYDLRQKSFFENKGEGRHIWHRTFADGWMHIQGKIYKLDVVEIEYEQMPVRVTEIKVDFEDYVLAVMEFINTNKENAMVLKDGQRRPI
jgi:hypothetical protein